AGFEASGRVALAVEVLNEVHTLAMKNDFPNVAMKTEATLVVAADQITARLKKYEVEAIAKLKAEENIVPGEEIEPVEAKPMDPAKIFAAMGTTRQAAFKRFNTVFQNNLNPEFLNFQSNESAESLLIASKTISPMFETATLFINEQEAAPMFETATLFINEQEAAAQLAIEELGLMATKAYGSENIEELDALFQKLRSLPVLLFSLKTKTIAAQALWNLESMLKKLRETLAARALEPAAETPEEPSNIAGETPPLSDIDQQFLSTMSPLFEKLHVAAEGGDLKAADYYYGELKQLYVDFSSQGLSDGAIVTFKTQMEEAYQLLETARMAPAA
ncbi:MAG: hypothetical protein HYW49_01245, partial [Deltaproteobacteria bacterium]|nr:hypothetical protein [Deltaproteobacteria bacterium]